MPWGHAHVTILQRRKLRPGWLANITQLICGRAGTDTPAQTQRPSLQPTALVPPLLATVEGTPLSPPLPSPPLLLCREGDIGWNPSRGLWESHWGGLRVTAGLARNQGLPLRAPLLAVSVLREGQRHRQDGDMCWGSRGRCSLCSVTWSLVTSLEPRLPSPCSASPGSPEGVAPSWSERPAGVTPLRASASRLESTQLARLQGPLQLPQTQGFAK